MHVLIATDGTLDADQVVDHASRLAGDGTVTVLTVVEVPRRLLDELRAVYGEQARATVETDIEYVGMARAGRDPVGWPGDDAMLRRYLDDRKHAVTDGIVDALQVNGIAATGVAIEHESASAAIIDYAKQQDVDVICIGALGQSRLEELIGSNGTKIVRRAHCPVLVLR